METVFIKFLTIQRV
uniref:Uncharacterized protein n=1 Tax=Rhizophora mucronata TaxID=61149 RepID=A0A2P2R4W0_RHIMU